MQAGLAKNSNRGMIPELPHTITFVLGGPMSKRVVLVIFVALLLAACGREANLSANLLEETTPTPAPTSTPVTPTITPT
jgi:hypothetical protein